MERYSIQTENRCVRRIDVGRYRQSGKAVSKAKWSGSNDCLTRDNVGRTRTICQDTRARPVAGHLTDMLTKRTGAEVTTRVFP